ncbi:unnamed protein product [Didymodactylos carnosus]|uniref:Tesmin/TSO1-like CXC domain-containing protein n=1 Tax=Didymodactylos carnosus TaxID=1234261 RepID=A0A814RWA9_9BILA|nr:unnamed protein product [Didymodactylos carnosus]CAF3901055.1 unnamed protein product [Didymodactylos carnosus]
MNRFGHSCSYKAIVRLHQEAADIVANSPSSSLPSNTQQQQQFIVKVADNFDLNKDSLHGENSIHILNQILVQTSENDELFIDVSKCLNQLCDNIVNLDSRNSTTSFLIPSTKTTTSSARKQYAPYEPFVDDSYKTILLAYGVSKLACDHSSNLTTVFSGPKHVLPLLAGFCATYLQHVQRPLHTVSFCIPINADPTSLPTAELCLRTTKSSILDSNYQQEAVVVVDEKIYRNCIKAKGLNSIEFEDITIYAGDFHLMKNFQIVIWDVLTGSGIEDVLGCIYKGASLKSIWNVHHFNKSLRCCKLLYTALSILFLRSFCEALLTTATSSSLSPSIINILQETITEIPSEYAIDDIKQKWFNRLLNSIDKLRLSSLVDEWAKDNCQKNVTFKFWCFILHYLLQPLITMYMSIRMSNFEGRNASLCQMAPIFFATNHRNYARLSARHLINLRASSGYIQQRLKKSFAVNRTNRPFSFIALDQTIECSINKFGKSYGGITGKFNPQLIDIWVQSFAYRSLMTSITHEIAGLETRNNTIDAHVECAPQRIINDDKDLTAIILKLKDEKLFTIENQHCRKILSGLIIHNDIIDNICSSYERGLKAMSTYIQERYIDCNIHVDERLSAMKRLKLVDAATYSPGNILKRLSMKKNNECATNQFVKAADEQIRKIIVLSEFRELRLDSLFSFEFSPAPFSLCDSQNINFFNQQKKSSIVDYFKEQFPTAFSTTESTITNNSNYASIIDGGSLLEIKPLTANCTVYDYAKQLFEKTILPQFKSFYRIDIIFDSAKSRSVKSFTKRHGNDDNSQEKYDLKIDDILETRYHHFVHKNRAALAQRLRDCWCQPTLFELIPNNKIVVVAGPDTEAVALKKNKMPLTKELLESEHVEADTRLFLHVYDIRADEEDHDRRCDGILVQAADTDIILLSIAFSKLIKIMQIPNFVIKSFNTCTKTHTFIDITKIGKQLLDRIQIKPSVLLVLHGLSGCDSTSFIKNITKINFFRTYFNNPQLYKQLIDFGESTTVIQQPLEAAEQLLISCYTNKNAGVGSKSSLETTTQQFTSLDQLRKSMAITFFKQKTKKSIALDLLPTTDAFYLHCERAWKQVYIWKNSFEPYLVEMPEEQYGYEKVNDQISIKWRSKPPMPANVSLSTCGKCVSGCKRCKCGSNGLRCTIYCQCSRDKCTNGSNIQHVQSISIDRFYDDEEDDDGDDDISDEEEEEEEKEEFIKNLCTA